MAAPTPPPPSAVADVLAGLCTAAPGCRGAVVATGEGVVVRSTLADPSIAQAYAASAVRLAAKARAGMRALARAPAVVAAAAAADSAAAAAAAGNGGGVAGSPPASGGPPESGPDSGGGGGGGGGAPSLLRVRARSGAEVSLAPVWDASGGGGSSAKLAQCVVVVQAPLVVGAAVEKAGGLVAAPPAGGVEA